MDFLPPNVNLTLLRIYMAVTAFAAHSAVITTKIVNALYNAFEPRRYYFLQNYTTPYPVRSVNIYASSSAPVQFEYNADTKQFIKDEGSVNEVPRNLPILSLEIVRDNTVVYDLTDFIENITVLSTDEVYPSTAHIIGAWMIESHVILHRGCDFIVRMVDTDGDTIEADVYNTIDLGLLDAGDEVEEVQEDLSGATAHGEASSEALKIE